MENENNTKNIRPVFSLGLGFLLIFAAICLLLYDRFMFVKDEVFTEINMKLDEEKYNDDLVDGNVDDEEINENIDEPSESTSKNSTKKNSTSTKKTNNYRYLGYLTIPKINLKTGIPWKNSPYNNVDYGVYTLPMSKYPDVKNGNLVLASHSGNASISYFKNLWKLAIGDTANVSYNGKKYSYKIVDIYYVPKTGTIQIRRDNTKTVLTLITCTKNSNTQQTVYILELYAIDGVNYG